MVVVAGLLIFVASVLHSWYSANSLAKPGNAPMAFRALGVPVLLGSIILMIIGSLLLWSSVGIAAALVALGIYSFAMPLVITPMLEAAGLVPDKRARYTHE